jgi:hypothetical protein
MMELITHQRSPNSLSIKQLIDKLKIPLLALEWAGLCVDKSMRGIMIAKMRGGEKRPVGKQGTH